MASNPKENTTMRMRGLTKWMLIACLVILTAHSGEAAESRVVCYYTNWSVYRPGTAKFNPQNINPYLCTHLIYAFGGFTKENTLKPFDKYQDIEKGGYAKFTGLKTYNPNLKTMIAIGGWNEGSSRFSSLAASAERRREFVKNTIKFLRQNKFDGLDLDWEYPAFRDGGKPKDKPNYAKLVQELRQEFDKESEATGRPRLLLTMAVPAGVQYIDKGFDVPKLNRYLDWMNILSYDYHTALESAVDHHSPLFPLEAASEYNFDSDLNIDYSIKYYIERGADRDKLVLGIPTYGRSYTLFNPESHALGAPADGPGEQGEGTREKGYLAYYEICENLLPKTKSERRKRQADDESDEDEYEDEEEEEEWTVVQPNPKAMGPYAYKGNQWVGYDDIDIVTKKAEYVAENGLGGIMFWSIDNDDFRGKCHGKPYPLIEAAKVALYRSLGVTEKLPEKKPFTTRKRTRPSKPVKTAEEDKDLSRNTIRNSKKKTRLEESEVETTTKSSSRVRANFAKRASTTASPSLAANTPDWGLNTPEPPTTPDPGTDFKCVEDGFFPHPRDCKKYFWCLDSGPSNLGIVAHQFTCPSGLYFNKDADSCDFARNVFCKIKASTPAPSKATTTSRTTARTTTQTSTFSTSTTTARPPSNLAALFTTRRPPSRITAATSSTTLLQRTTTTTPSSIEEEFEDSEESVEEEGNVPDKDTEEDPRVIKELVDLIKKLGGIEQLEKHLANTGGATQGTKTTTPATISRLLYEKVLSQKRPNSERGPPQFNSRGPQAAGLEGTVVDSNSGSRRERPQYTTINRRRPATTTEEALQDSEELSEEDEDQEDYRGPSSTTARTGHPQYVNILRGRSTTTTEAEPTIRNALFERDSIESTSDNDDVKNGFQGFENAAIRKYRPDSKETSTSKYKTIQRVRSSTTAAPVEDKDDSERSTISFSEVSRDAPATPSPFTETSVMTSSKYATVSRFPTTFTPEIVETTTFYKQSDTTDVNDINVDIASPSFASENGIIKNVDSSTILNAQITTLSNIPKTKDESNSFVSSPIAYSTEVTISEEPSSTTQKVSLFAKRTRPTTTTTTANPPDITESTSSANKVSFDRKYVSVKRTRLPVSPNTSSSLRARLNNDIDSDTGREVTDDEIGSDSALGESNDNDRFIPRNRKIRSTTPASDENKNGANKTGSSESNYGNKRFVRPQSRFTTRTAPSTSQEVITDKNIPISNKENSSQNARRFSSRRTSPEQATYRTRKLQTSNTQTAELSDSEFNASENENQSELLTTSRRPQPRRQFRPSFNSFESDFSSLTALDYSKKRDDNVEQSSGIRNTQVNRRFRPSYTSITKEPVVEDSVNSDSSITPVVSNRQRNYVTRGSRFTTTRSISREYDDDQNTEASETSVIPRGRKISVSRFTPRPFSRVTQSEEEDLEDLDDSDLTEDNELNAEVSFESKPIGTARLTAPVINVQDNKSKESPLSISLGSINVTKVINSNALLGQSNNRSGLLILRRPTSNSQSTNSKENISASGKFEGVQLSETNYGEKQSSNQTSNALPDRPRKRVIVKKLRSTSTAPANPTTEGSVLENNRVTKRENLNDSLVSDVGKNETGRLRVRKVLRRRPATSTTAADQTTTEPIPTQSETERPVLNTTNEVKNNTRRIKIVRRLKPVVTNEGKVHILETKNEEPLNKEIADLDKDNSIDEFPTTNYENLITTENTDDSDGQVDETTLPSSTTRFRPTYRPPKRPLNPSSTTTEASATPKVYSRKYNNGPYTTPILPSERETDIVTDRPRPEGLTRRPTFSVRPFSRRPATTSRTTTNNDEDEEEYSEEAIQNENNEEDKLVFVPVDQLFTRGPVSKTSDSEPPSVDQDSEDEDTVSEELENEDENSQANRVSTTVRPVNRFIVQRPSVTNRPGLPNGRQPNRPLGINRPVEASQPNTNDNSRRFNRPVAFQPNRSNRFGASPTQSPTESTSKGFSRKYAPNRPTTESTPSEVDKDIVNAKHKQLFSNPKRFTSTTPVSPSQETTTDNEEFTTEFNVETTTDIGDTGNTETDFNNDDWLSNTEISQNEDITTVNAEANDDVTGVPDIQTTNEPTTNRASISTKESDVVDTTSTTEPHHIFAVNNSETVNKTIEGNTVYSLLDASTDTPQIEMSTEFNFENGSVKTSSHLDRLFAVSRVVEVSSKQEKHRLNSKNESRLIEVGEVKQESKPTLDKIGEVSRYTLIKIVEGDIPKYLTNLSREYPVDNPPFNPIRIDEARNARNLNERSSDAGKEQLIASESVNAAYNHKNGYIDYIEASAESENIENRLNERVFVVESTTILENITLPEQNVSTTTSIPETTQSQFVPGAVTLEEILNLNNNASTQKTPAESSTISLEGLFNSNVTITGRQSVVPGPQPFVVYAAPQSSIDATSTTLSPSDEADTNDTRTSNGRSIANFVQIQVLRPDEDKNIKEKEFLGVPAAAEVLVEKKTPVVNSPIMIKIINGSDVTNENTSTVASTSTLEPVTIVSVSVSDINSSQTVSTVGTTKTTEASTESILAASNNETISTTESSSSSNTNIVNVTTTASPEDSKISLLNIQSTTDTNNSTLSTIALKRPKLPYLRRYQNNQVKSSNITRISASPSTSQNVPKRTYKSSLESKNVPFTTPKYNRTNSYTSGKSRFSAVRTQNVPVDARKQKNEPAKFKPGTTTEKPKVSASSPESSNRVTIRPFRPAILRSSLFARRTTTEPTTQVSEE